jgi:hypothetical protein
MFGPVRPQVRRDPLRKCQKHVFGHPDHSQECTIVKFEQICYAAFTPSTFIWSALRRLRRPAPLGSFGGQYDNENQKKQAVA